MNPKLLGVIATLGVAGASAVTLATDECFEMLCVVPVLDAKTGEVIGKTQKNFRFCGSDEKVHEATLPKGAECAPTTATPVKTKLLASSKALTAEEVDSPCACAPTKPLKGDPCEALTRDLSGKETWGKPPVATVMQPDAWRGACVLSDCWETWARAYAGSEIPEACGGPVKVVEAPKGIEAKP